MLFRSENGAGLLVTHVQPSTLPVPTAPAGKLSSTHAVGFGFDTEPFTTCDNAALPDAALDPSPPYVAAIECVPAASALAAHAAVRVLPLPVSVTAPQPPIALPPSVNATVPVGDDPVTLAVKVTLPPAVEGFDELATVVVVAAGPLPPMLTLTVTPEAFAEMTLKVTP